MTQMPDARASKAEPPIASPADARTLVNRLCDVMDALLGTVDQETELVRAGRLPEALELETAKAALASEYLASSERVRANLPFLTQSLPTVLDDLRQRHDNFQALLKINMTVLATAHAISETVVRGAANEVARKTNPQTYGATGRTVTPGRNAIAPVTVSRSL